MFVTAKSGQNAELLRGRQTCSFDTLARWSAFYETVLKAEGERLGGQIRDLHGDGVLLEFGSVLNAVKWARAVHVAAAATKVDGKAAFVLRVAIHMGEVLVTSEGIFGDAVNLTARLQEHAAPGGTVISETVRQALRGSLTEQLLDLGLLRFKNDERPFRAFDCSRMSFWLGHWLSPFD